MLLPEDWRLYSERKAAGTFVTLKIILLFRKKNNPFWNSANEGKASYSGICYIVKWIGEIKDYDQWGISMQDTNVMKNGVNRLSVEALKPVKTTTEFWFT